MTDELEPDDQPGRGFWGRVFRKQRDDADRQAAEESRAAMVQAALSQPFTADSRRLLGVEGKGLDASERRTALRRLN